MKTVQIRRFFGILSFNFAYASEVARDKQFGRYSAWRSLNLLAKLHKSHQNFLSNSYDHFFYEILRSAVDFGHLEWVEVDIGLESVKPPHMSLVSRRGAL